ncbi:hypothetical protein KY321_03430 [Candidatus Woesearchaeota archaeon]|nr:hypothetical protein [Candidatus Woesearchaeota archaeon]
MVDKEYIESIKKKYLDISELAKKEGITTDEIIEKQNDNDHKLAEKRGYILNRLTEFEHLLNTIITNYFASKKDEFYNLILGKEFFTLHQKIRLFGELQLHKNEHFENKLKGLTGLMHDLKEMRNLVAHGTKAHGMEPRVSYVGKKSKALDDEFMNDFNEKFETVFLALNELNQYLVMSDR